MDEPKTREGELTPDELASYGISPKQPEEAKPIKGLESETKE